MSKIIYILILSLCCGWVSSFGQTPPTSATIAATDAQIVDLNNKIAALYKQLESNPAFNQWLALQREEAMLEGDQVRAKQWKAALDHQAAHDAATKAVAAQSQQLKPK